MKNFIHGTVIKLTREDTLADIERHFKRMKDSGLDTAVVWPAFFWWEEKKEGYPFNTGRALLEIAERVGIKIIMELSGQLTAMEYAPDFIMKDEYYRKDRDGHSILPVSAYGFLNYFHPELDRIICAQFKSAASAYKDYPALSGYDVFNETAFSSFDEYTIDAFRDWLKKKYKTVERLNEVWERTYTDFSQVDYAVWTWMSIMPVADFGAFRREAVGMHLERWCNAIREVDNTRPLIADNIGSMVTNGVGMYDRPQDDFVLGEVMDEVGVSFYPKQIKGTQPVFARWCALDSLYAASMRRGFYISEMQTHIQAMFNPTTAVRKHELKQWCCEGLAAGAKSLIYWMWRPFTKGLQTSGRGLVDYLERSTPRLEFVKEFSELLATTGALTPTRGRVGILYDRQCLDFQILYTKSYLAVDQNIYSESVVGAYRAMHDAGIKADIVQLDEIGNYKLIILPNHIVIGKKTADALRKFAESGGTLLLDGKAGVVDDFSMLNTPLPGGEFNACMGLSYIDTDYEGLDFELNGKAIEGYYGREITELSGGVAIASFSDGTPAIVENAVGLGRVITVNTNLFYGYSKGHSAARELCESLNAELELRQISVSAPLKVRCAEGNGVRYAFVFNYTNEDAHGNLSGLGFNESVSVSAGDVVILTVKI